MMDGSSFFSSLSSQLGASPLLERLVFNGISNSMPVKGPQVWLHSSSEGGDRSVGSSNLKLKTIVNFTWDPQYYPGQLSAVHKNGDFVAYGILTPNKNEGVVRVLNMKNQNRALLKGMKGRVKDLAFAHTEDEIILGCVDEQGSLFIFSIKDDGGEGTLEHKKILEISGKSPTEPSDYHRIIWCPFLPDDDFIEEDKESPAKLLVLTHNNVATMWNVGTVIARHGSGPHKDPESLKTCRLEITGHTKPISAASFSPDGTALATASLDGKVKFFQVYMNGSSDDELEPRCLHQWTPHEGKPVTSLFFLDNHKDNSGEAQFWKYAVTGADYNSELKIWSCESWSCLQTLAFKPLEAKPDDKDNNSTFNDNFSTESAPTRWMFKAAMDLRARFILLSNIYTKKIYVFQLQEIASKMQVISATEFQTPQPFLSMSLIDAGERKVDRDGHTASDLESDSDEDSDDDYIDGHHEGSRSRQLTRDATVISLVLVQPKSFQHCRIVYDDAWQEDPLNKGNFLAELEGGEVSSPEVIKVVNGNKTANGKNSSSNNASNGGEKSKNGNSGRNEVKTEQVETEPEDEFQVPELSSLVSAMKMNMSNPSLDAAAVKINTLLSPDAIKAGAMIHNASSSSMSSMSSMIPNYDKNEVKDEIILDNAENDEVDGDVDDNDSDDVEDIKPTMGRRLKSNNSSPSEEVAVILKEAANLGLPPHQDPYATNEDDGELEDDFEDDDSDIDEDFEEPEDLQSDLETKYSSDPLANVVPLVSATTAAGNGPLTVKSAVGGANWGEVPAPPVLPIPAKTEELKGDSTVPVSLDSSSIELLLSKMSEMTTLVRNQGEEIRSLKTELKHARKASEKKAEQLEKHLEKAMRKNKEDIATAVKKDSDAKYALAINSLSQTVPSALLKTLEKTLRDDVAKVANRAMENSFSSVQKSLKGHIQSLNSQTERSLQESWKNVSKMTADSISRQINDKMTPTLGSAINRQVETVILPALDRCFGELLAQIRQMFLTGTMDYLKETKTMSSAMIEGVTKQLPDPKMFQAQMQQTQIQNEEAKVRQADLIAAVRRIVNSELSESFRQHTASITNTLQQHSRAMGSGTPNASHLSTPPNPSPRDQIMALEAKIKSHLAQGAFDTAFQMALNANNLQLVLQVCGMVNPVQIFSTPCQLSQSCLLSLISQLSTDLDSKSELKHDYLQDAIMCLNLDDPIVIHNKNRIIAELQHDLTQYISSHPSQEKMTKSMRMLLMATKSLGHGR